MADCIINSCSRETDQDMCSKHRSAKISLEETFESWETAYGNKYTWARYLKEILKDDLGVGIWVLDIVKHLTGEISDNSEQDKK